MPVRVVRVAERRRAGAALVATGLLGTLIHPAWGGQEVQPWLLQLFITMCCVGTLLGHRPRPRAILRVLGIAWPGSGTVEVVTRSETVRRAQRVVGGLGLVMMVLGAIAQIVAPYTPGGAHPDYTRITGPAAVLAIAISLLVFLFDPLLRRRYALGAARAETPPGSGSRVDEHVRAHLLHRVAERDRDDAEPAPASARGGARVLDKGSEETTHAWLSRIDALSREDGYRGGGLTREELWRLLEDPALPERARLGAARLLSRRADGDAAEVRARIVDALEARPAGARSRLRVVLEEESAEAAAVELDELGPTFHARRLR